MRLTNFVTGPGTAADVFMSRYQWLLRWAMHFAQNDRATAEDLIQDTFLRFCQANLKVAEIRDAEALLYTYLEYVYLAHVREVKRHSFVSLADAKLDALALGLLTGPDVDRIEAQNVLRRIAAYVSWRKQTSKSASIVALRFFHGYLPDEIACIALMSRDAVDERLHKGRNEIRLHLLDSDKLREIQHGGPVEIFPAKIAVPADALLAELLNQLFHAPHGACMSSEQLIARYQKGPDAPIHRDLLAHLVCCPKCLAIVEQICRINQGPHVSGEPFGMNRRGPQREFPPSSRRAMQNTMLCAQRRLKEVFEHRPTSLIVAVNGEILASRDIRASFNGLKVEALARDIKFIEILSELGISLLSWAVESTPPHSGPVVHREAEFSMGRRLEVDLQFSAQKLVVEVQYYDPLYRDIFSPSFVTAGSSSDEEDETETTLGKAEDSPARALHVNLLTRWQSLTTVPLIVTGLVCAVLMLIVFTIRLHGPNGVKPAEFLQRAAAAERQDAQSEKSGAIFQQVSIRSSQGTFERSIYRDPKGKRHMKEQALDEKKADLKKRLAEAGISWDAPLSAASFQDWQAHSRIRNESVHSAGNKFLTLRVDTEGSDVEQETITIRTSDFHPISRTAEFRDLGRVEIAELNYAVVPWATVNQDLFVSDSIGSGPLAASPRSLQLPERQRPIPDAELDLAELDVRSALHDLHADFTDRLTISRSVIGVRISGLVEDEEQKSEVKRRLDLIPHVSTNLTTVSEASRHPEETSPPANVHLVSVVAGPSLLESFLQEEGRSRDASNDLADRLFAASTELVRANNALLQLRHFTPERLSPDALDLYHRLIASWYDELDIALRKESEAIQQTGIQMPPDKAAEHEPVDMAAGIDNNRTLLKELIGHDAPGARTAPVVLADLAHSVESLHKMASEQYKQASQITFSAALSANNSHR
ncbi:MAG TPA: sigma-70 family RNA polymerase sigma factor [Terriglobales bacterium]|nr:sigma-70 family RNA polymerase sigma factor [Terriglobales bacterium]